MKNKYESPFVYIGVAVIAALVVTLWFLLGPPDTRRNKIAFVRNGDIWIMKVDGTEQQRVTDYGRLGPDEYLWWQSAPMSWSNSGAKLAIAGIRDEPGVDIYDTGAERLKPVKSTRGIHQVNNINWLTEDTIIFAGRDANACPPTQGKLEFLKILGTTPKSSFTSGRE